MKEKFTLRNALICCAALLAILVFVFSFLASYRVAAGTNYIEYKGIIWGSSLNIREDGTRTAMNPAVGALALPLIGAILTLVGGLCACCLAFFGEKVIKDEKVRKIILFVAAGLMILGGVFSFIYEAPFKDALGAQWKAIYGVGDFSYVEAAWKVALSSSTYTTSCALPIISGILAIVGGGAIVCSQFVADKKLGK